MSGLSQDQKFEVEVFLFLGNKARDAGRFDEADTQYGRVLAIDQKEWRAHYGLANVLFDKATTEGRYINYDILEKSSREYKLAIKYSVEDANTKAGDLAELYSDAGQAYLYNREYSAAQTSIKRAIALNPRSASAFRRLGNVNYHYSRFDDAIREYRVSLSFDNDNPRTYLALGMAYFIKKQYDEASQAFKEAVRLRPENPEGYEWLGDTYLQKKAYADARAWYERALKIESSLVDARYGLSRAFCGLGDRDSAQREYQKLRAIDVEKANELYSRIRNCPPH